MTILNNIVFSATEPTSTNVLWVKPNEESITVYAYSKGSWVSGSGGSSSSQDIDKILDKINGEVV